MLGGGPHWVGLKSESRNAIQVSHVGGRNSVTSASTEPSRVCVCRKREADVEQGTLMSMQVSQFLG